MGRITGGKTPKEVAKLTIPLCFSEDFIKNNPDFIEFIIKHAPKKWGDDLRGFCNNLLDLDIIQESSTLFGAVLSVLLNSPSFARGY